MMDPYSHSIEATSVTEHINPNQRLESTLILNHGIEARQKQDMFEQEEALMKALVNWTFIQVNVVKGF